MLQNADVSFENDIRTNHKEPKHNRKRHVYSV